MKLKVYETKNYFGLQKEDQVRNKIGYINKNGWLNASDELKEILSKLNLNWETGNSNGGTKEIWKFKFVSYKTAFEKLKEINIEFLIP
jgi:hypothetical protein